VGKQRERVPPPFFPQPYLYLEARRLQGPPLEGWSGRRESGISEVSQPCGQGLEDDITVRKIEVE